VSDFEAVIERNRKEQHRATLLSVIPMPDRTPASDVPRVLVDGKMRHNNIAGALATALIAGMAPELAARLPSIYTSRQRNSYCLCGKVGQDGRRLKFKNCCGAGR
jgi:hypothetical protein